MSNTASPPAEPGVYLIANYEMEFPENAPMKPPREFMQPFGGFLGLVFIKYQKGGNKYG